MSDIIRLLPDSVANQIAAGEVIQRPSAVIKELVENSVDAGASEIRIVIKDAGKTLIQVADNGSGMSETDVRMAFERHATSKISKADDLFSLHTMGFRGEALPSICAISEVEVRTRTADSTIGTRIIIAGSKVTLQEPCVCDVGTVISVRKIFYNIPARRKFLKSDNVELSNIMREFERLALVNNNIRMSIDTGTKVLDLRASSLRMRIEDIWKNTLKSDHLIPINVETDLVKIEGFVSRPEYARRRNPLQYLIVNGRNMRHPYFHKAIVNCYESLIASDTMPCYFMKFTVDPSTIDVNIHPTKNEIKFEYEQQIWPIIVSAVKTALGKFSAVPSIDFSIDAIPLNPLRDGDYPVKPHLSHPDDYNPFRSAHHHNTRVESNWEKLFEGFSQKDLTQNENYDVNGNVGLNTNYNENLAILPLSDSDTEVASVCLQYALKYIVTTTRDGLLLIDQHRAHVKILFEEYLKMISKSEIVARTLMFPDTIELDAAQQTALDDILEDLSKLGFKLEYECDSKWQILTVPAMIGNVEPRDIIYRILDSVAIDTANYGKEGDVRTSMNERLALMMARSTAIRRGQKLSVGEMESIISSLFALPDPSFTPSGNSIFTTLDEMRISALLS